MKVESLRSAISCYLLAQDNAHKDDPQGALLWLKSGEYKELSSLLDFLQQFPWDFPVIITIHDR